MIRVRVWSEGRTWVQVGIRAGVTQWASIGVRRRRQRRQHEGLLGADLVEDCLHGECCVLAAIHKSEFGDGGLRMRVEEVVRSADRNEGTALQRVPKDAA